MKKSACISHRFCSTVSRRRLLVSGCLLLALSGRAADPNPAFQVEFFGTTSGNVPKMKITNLSREQITKVVLTMGHDKDWFDARLAASEGRRVESSYTTPPDGGAVYLDSPTNSKVFSLEYRLEGFDYDEFFQVQIDIDGAGDDIYWYELFNAPGNAIFTVTDANGQEEVLTLPDKPVGPTHFTFLSDNQPRDLVVSSSSGLEAGTSSDIYVTNCTVKLNSPVFYDVLYDTDENPTENIGRAVTIRVYDGETIEISVPQSVYQDEDENYLTDSSNLIADELKIAMQRFEAIGISIDNVPQTGDPTFYRFNVSGDARIIAKWRHDYALRIENDLDGTASLLDDLGGIATASNAWVGPVESEALGNPDPDVKLHWIPKGDTVVATVDGQVIDYTHPGLDVRFVPVSYDSSGSAVPNYDADLDETNNIPFIVGQAPPARQQTEEFVMDGPGRIEYVWELQYGVTVNIDDVSRAHLPVVREIRPGVTNNYFGEGTFWFDPGLPGTSVQVLCRADDAGKALGGWINGDGYYFKSAGAVYPPDGSLEEGAPDHCQWVTNVELSIKEGTVTNSYTYYGMEISGFLFPGIQRPARVMWTYGNPAIAVTVPIGEYVLQSSVSNTYGYFDGESFQTEPEQIRLISVAGRNTQVAETEMAIWDPEAAKLYPLVPGAFRAVWSNEIRQIDVLVRAEYPGVSHYPHIADTPPVSLDPDSADSFVFKELRYSENAATVDENSYFRAETPGWSVLLFGKLQQQSRGAPREFLQVRTVETKAWQDQDVLNTTRTAVIGQAIADDALDRAELGTGYVLFENAHYNPLIYDAEKLDGLAAQDVYDMDALQSTDHIRDVVQPGNLPGPVIPVNLHPAAQAEDRIVVVWYDDPAQNDQLIWPYAARTYDPLWPVNEAQGLRHIVIASQYGSECQIVNGVDQMVVGAVTNLTADSEGNTVTNIYEEEVTYNPSRLQQVQVYNQPDPREAGYNPNEEHALLAPSLKNAAVSPRPSAVYALRNNDLNITTQDGTYTSDPYVLIQFFDTADQTYKMKVYDVVDESLLYSFADVTKTTAAQLRLEDHVVMEAGEPVIPFYPLGVVWGAVVPPETFGTDLLPQLTYWEDHKGTSWAVSGGTEAWFTQSPYYPLQPDFWWPDNEPGTVIAVDDTPLAALPAVGSSLSFLPEDISELHDLNAGDDVSSISSVIAPVEILYKSDWPENPPTLKAGETLTFSGGEYRADYPTLPSIVDGETIHIETPGLPGVLAFAAAEVVFDSRNPTGSDSLLKTDWTARIAQVLEKRSVELLASEFPSELAPASGRTRISQGKYVFNELPASLQKRFRYDPILQKIEIFGLVNDKDIGEDTLTASPPQVYVLEPNILTTADLDALRELDGSSAWRLAVNSLYELTRNPDQIEDGADRVIDGEYLVGLERKILRNPSSGEPNLVPIEPGSDVLVYERTNNIPAPLRAFGPGLALLPNAEFMDPAAGLLPESWVTVVENNDPSLGGSPITPHIIRVKRDERYRGAIKTVLSDNVFDENVVLRHQGDFGANADALYFEWWYRPDDGSLNVPPPDDELFNSSTSPWKLFPDLTGEQGKARYETMLKGNPNAPEALLADTWWFCRYRHKNDTTDGVDWGVNQLNGDEKVNFTWAGAGNSDPKGVYNYGIPDYKAQLVMGWIKRVLDAVNPYEARIRDFEGDSPSTVVSMISQFGARFEGPVALNPDKNVIENVGLIELYETILKRGRDLSIDLSRPVSTPAIANALQLAATRISDFYTLLANEAYTDALDPTIGHGSESAAYGDLAPSVFTFQNQMSSLIEEELALLRGVDDNFARPVYNRLFWNFTKGEGEAAYAVNYNISDVNMDGFVDEDDAMITYPQGHGDAWGHYLTALRNQYDLLNHKYFNWVSRSEFYNLMDIVMKVDFLDERKFAQMAAAKAQAGAEIVDLTYREKYVEDPEAQWQGYTDSDELRGWGVQGWARRAAQGAYFDWITANALLPAEHPNGDLEGIQKVDRKSNSDIAVISANLNRIQRTFDQANSGYNPLGVARDAVPMDIDPQYISFGRTDLSTHFGQMYDRAVKAMANAKATWDHANKADNMLRKIGTTEADYRNKTFQQDLSYRNKLISIFGRPYEGTIGSGKLYPAGYDGPDLALHMYIGTREINNDTVPGPAASFATFNESGVLDGGDMNDALNWSAPDVHALSFLAYSTIPILSMFNNGDVNHLGLPHSMTLDLGSTWRSLYAPSFAGDIALSLGGGVPAKAQDGLYSVAYTDLENPKVPLDGFADLMPVTTAGYTYQAPDAWGARLSEGKLQQQLSGMLQQEAAIANAIASWDGLAGKIVRELRIINAKWVHADTIQLKDEIYSRVKTTFESVIKGIEGAKAIAKAVKGGVDVTTTVAHEAVPKVLPTGGVAVSPGDALSPARAGFVSVASTVKKGIDAVEEGLRNFKLYTELALKLLDTEISLWEKREKNALSKKEWLKSLENMVGDEPAKRIAVFKAIEGLRQKSEQYKMTLDEGARLIDERIAFNKRVSAQIQRNRYQDMTFRVSRNHALENYRAAYDLAAMYAYLAAKAYDYETNFDASDPFSAQSTLEEIVKARSLGLISSGKPQIGAGGLAEALAKMKANFDVVYSQMGLSNPQWEVSEVSLREEFFRILPKGMDTSTDEDNFPSPGGTSDELWQQTLESSRVEDLWQVPEFRQYCRPFASEYGVDDNYDPQPGLVIRFATSIKAGENVFGHPLTDDDYAYDPSLYSTRIRGTLVSFDDYTGTNVPHNLPDAPRVYLIPAGADIMSVANSPDPNEVRIWNVLDQKIPAPMPAVDSELDNSSWVPLYDTLSGQYGEIRRYSSFRAGGDPVYNSRLVGRSVWNTEWVLIIPGITFNADPKEGLDRFIGQVSDIKLVFDTYGYSGN